MGKRREKTYLMQLIEHNHGRSIRDIMIDAYIEHGSERAAAKAIGVTQQSFNSWKFRLGIEDQITPQTGQTSHDTNE
jgi:hypothetical protein